MSSAYNNRWERSKRYLLQNFLVNPRFELSPIPEEERSSSASSGSLPELVIVREPNRHDEPDAFYEGLERRMRRFHRQLFLGENISDDETSSDFNVTRSMTSTFINEDHNAALSDQQNTASEQRISGSNVNMINERTLRDLTNEYRDDDSSENQIRHEDSEQIDSDTDHEESVEEDGVDIESTKTASGNFKIITNDIVTVPEVHEIDDNRRDSCSNDIRPSLVNTSRFKPDSLSVLKAQKTRDSYKTIESNSDIEESTPCHRISTTVADIHEPVRMSTRVFGSPVLMPKLIHFNKSIFGRRIRYASQTSLEDMEDSGEVSQDINDYDVQQEENINKNIENDEIEKANINEGAESGKGTKKYGRETENILKEADNIEKEIEDVEEETESIEEQTGNIEGEENIEGDTDNIEGEKQSIEKEAESIGEQTTVLRLVSASDITTVSRDSAVSPQSDILSKDDESINDDRHEHGDVHRISRHTIKDQSHKNDNQPRIVEESIGPDEFHTALDSESTKKSYTRNTWDNDNHGSLENALRKGLFESKNARKTSAQSTDEEMESSDENFDPVEKIRRPREEEIESSDENFDPVEEIREPREEEMESSDENFESAEEIRGPREAGVNVSLRRESAGTEDSPVPAFEARTSADKLEELSSDSEEDNALTVEMEKESTESHHTPRSRTIVSAAEEFWSVSPIQVDIEESLNNSRRSKKRRTDLKDVATSGERKKKRKDVAIQASSSEALDAKWADIKANMFVGTPLVLRLCGCSDHVCP